MTSLSPHNFNPSILREYDIRGVADETLGRDDAFAIGQTYASMVSESIGATPTIVVGRDGRLSSPALANQLMAGMQAAGATVVDVGVGPTPMLYFGVYHLDVHAGVMVTGSHNPPTHNGFKLMLGRGPFYGEQIRELGRRVEAGQSQNGRGELRSEIIKVAYLDAMLDACDIEAEAPMHVAWDPGNGAAGEIANMLAKQLGKRNVMSYVIHAEIDGRFPNHHPDPSVVENLKDVQALVAKQGCAVGLAFDGDGDRLGAVDDLGRPVSSDHLLMLFAQAVLKDKPGGTIIADVKSSQTVFDAIKTAGGKPLMWKTGHSHIKVKMKQVGAPFAGEASGHIFFADRYYGFDDGLYAALRLIEVISKLNGPLSVAIDALPRMYSTPEIRIDVAEERKFVMIDEIRARLDAAGVEYLAIDGVRVMTDKGWWLIRASNTQAAIIARAESADEAGLKGMTAMLRDQLEASGVRLELETGF